jgi:hypothetical protein
MQIAGMLLGCVLLGGGPTTGHPVRPVEIVAEAMLLPVGSAVAGQPLTLLAALGPGGDRGQQLRVVRTYWRLTQAVAEYRFCTEHVKVLEQLRMASRSDAMVRLAEATAASQLREAELAVTRLQYELAEMARLPNGSPLPLPADRPLVAPYRTSIKELYAGRTPPEPARLADKILPLQHKAIEDRAAAVQAADDALAAVAENLQSGKGDSAAVVACSRELLRQQRAFAEAVCDYNRSIADYAFLVVNPATASQDLVAILIGPPQAPSGSTPNNGEPTKAKERPERPTSATEPIPPNPMRQADGDVSVPVRRQGEPTPAPPREEWERMKALRSGSPEGLKPIGKKDEPPLQTPPNGNGGNKTFVPEKPLTHIESLPPSSGFGSRTMNKPTAAASPWYSALVAAPRGARAKQLTATLHWDRSLPEGAGKPLSLADCLMRDSGISRRATIEAYWLVRQRAAQYQVLADQAELLGSVEPVVLEHRNQSSGASDMLRLQAAKLATQAMKDEAHVALAEAQYALALRIGAVGDALWPLASTVPHSGSYLLKLEAQPRGLAESWPVRRLAAMMPGLGENVQQRAATVIDADAERVAASERYARGFAAIDVALESITNQTEQTSAFLESLTAYNLAIAEYATTVLPPGVPAAKLAGALVAKP